MTENGALWSLPHGWVWKTMGDVARVVGGSTPKSKEPSYWGGDIPWLGVSDLTGYRDRYIAKGARSITRAGYDSCATQMVPAGTVLFSSRAPIGYVAIASNPICTSQGFKSFVPGDEILSEYLYWWLKSAKPIVESMASGTTFKEVSGKRAGTVPVPVPPLGEQRLIVAQLESLLAGVSSMRADLAAAHRGVRQLQALMIDRAADPGRWNVRKLGDLLERGLINGRSVPTADGGFPVLRLTALRGGGVVDLSQSKEGDWTAEEAAPFLVRHGDFLVGRGNGSLRLVGRGGLVAEPDPRPVAFPDTVIRVRAQETAILPAYLRLIWDSRHVRSQIEQGARTTAGIYKINQGMLRELRLPVPPLAEQAQLVHEAQTALGLLAQIEFLVGGQQLATTRLEQSILRDAVSGALRLPRGIASRTRDELQELDSVGVRGDA